MAWAKKALHWQNSNHRFQSETMQKLNWKIRGRIFDPSEHKLPLDCHSYAQSPQALIFDDFVRIYFSSRYTDSPGNFISRIVYIDMDHDFSKILNISAHAVLNEPELGAYDEHGIFPLHIFREEEKIFGYICGISRRQSVSVESSIGLSESFDGGNTFIRKGIGPVLTSSLHEPFLVCDPFVIKEGDTYHMWYIYGLRWMRETEASKPERVYKIAHATSFDQINWTKEGRTIISDSIDDNECQALPTVIKHGGLYHMVFCYRHAFGFKENKSKGYKLGYAISSDLQNWSRRDELLNLPSVDGEWDSDMRCYPHLFKLKEKIYLLYNGNEFGKFGFGLAELL
jgi:predicted GH43/DUF377 family glycosyl hydrolase